MTLDEFGRDLFAAVKTVGCILACQDQYAGAVNKSDKESMATILKRRDEFKAVLHKQVETLSDMDAADIVRRYPWVLT